MIFWLWTTCKHLFGHWVQVCSVSSTVCLFRQVTYVSEVHPGWNACFSWRERHIHLDLRGCFFAMYSWVHIEFVSIWHKTGHVQSVKILIRNSKRKCCKSLLFGKQVMEVTTQKDMNNCSSTWWWRYWYFHCNTTNIWTLYTFICCIWLYIQLPERCFLLLFFTIALKTQVNLFQPVNLN